MFERVRVEGGEADRGSPLVVQLVDVFVEKPGVEQSMGIVEPDLFNQHTDANMTKHFCDWGNIFESQDVLAPSPCHGMKHQHVEARVDNEPIEQNNQKKFPATSSLEL